MGRFDAFMLDCLTHELSSTRLETAVWILHMLIVKLRKPSLVVFFTAKSTYVYVCITNRQALVHQV